MNTFSDSLLITSAPTEILVGLAIFFSIAALLLVALSMEQGHYQKLKYCVQRLGWGFPFRGHRPPRWLFVPNPYHTVPEGN
jgi:hypothetical protein